MEANPGATLDGATLAAWAAAVVAIASTAITLWLQWWSRTQAEWSVIHTGIGKSVQDLLKDLRRTPRVIGAELTNVGDGTAFDVQVTLSGDPCEVIELDPATRSARLTPVAGAVMPGTRFAVVLPVDAPLDDAEQVLAVVWTSAPTRWGRRLVQTIPLTRQGFGARHSVRRAAENRARRDHRIP